MFDGKATGYGNSPISKQENDFWAALPIQNGRSVSERNLLHGTHPNIVNRNAAAVFRSDILTGAESVLGELEP